MPVNSDQNGDVFLKQGLCQHYWMDIKWKRQKVAWDESDVRSTAHLWEIENSEEKKTMKDKMINLFRSIKVLQIILCYAQVTPFDQLRATWAKRSCWSYPRRPQTPLRWKRGGRSSPNIQGWKSPGRSKEDGDTIPITNSRLGVGRSSGHPMSSIGFDNASQSCNSSGVGTLFE
eukprot:Gb_28191 [translate_table: standard]